MQPMGTGARRVALCMLLLGSLAGIFLMNSTASADISPVAEMSEITETAASFNTANRTANDRRQSEALPADADPVTETEDRESTLLANVSEENGIDLYENFVQMSGVSTEERDGVVFVPVRFFSEAMCDCTVDYDMNGTLTVSTEGLEVSATVGTSYITANGRYLPVKNGVTLGEDGQIWLPCDLMAKVFGCDYTYDADAQAVYLMPGDGWILPGEQFYNEKDLYWLSRIISAESRGEPFEGQLAVGTVVMNRVLSSRFPNNVHDVVFDGRQFSPAYSGTVYRDPDDISVIAAKVVLEGYRTSSHILFFHRASAAYRGFVNTEEEMVIGHHYFYTAYGR